MITHRLAPLVHARISIFTLIAIPPYEHRLLQTSTMFVHFTKKSNFLIDFVPAKRMPGINFFSVILISKNPRRSIFIGERRLTFLQLVELISGARCFRAHKHTREESWQYLAM